MKRIVNKLYNYGQEDFKDLLLILLIIDEKEENTAEYNLIMEEQAYLRHLYI